MSDPKSFTTLFRNARREAIICLIVWVIAVTWTVGTCYLYGFEHSPDAWVVQAGLTSPRQAGEAKIVFGMPDWIFWGVFVPWICCAGFTMLYSSFGMTDDDLGREAEGGGTDGH